MLCNAGHGNYSGICIQYCSCSLTSGTISWKLLIISHFVSLGSQAIGEKRGNIKTIIFLLLCHLMCFRFCLRLNNYKHLLGICHEAGYLYVTGSVGWYRQVSRAVGTSVVLDLHP